MSSDKSFIYDHIIEKFFKDHHDKDGLTELKTWQNWSKQEFFNYDTRCLIYRKFLQRRKQILDAHFEWTPANKERFVDFNRQIYKSELGLYNNLKAMKKIFKEMDQSRQWKSFLPINYTISGIRYTGSYIEGEDDDFPNILQSACPETYWGRDVRNSYYDGCSKLKKPTKDWGYEFNESQKECASIEAFQALPLHKHAGFLIFDSQIYALQDFVNMFICFEAFTEVIYHNR